jgi:hypothetical protein
MNTEIVNNQVTKICSKCQEEKPVTEFYKCRNYKDGLSYQCKICAKQYNSEHKKEIKLSNKQYYIENKDEIKLYHKQYDSEHKEEVSLKGKQHYLENKKEILLKSKQHYLENKDKILLRQKNHNLKHKDEIKLQKKRHYLEHKEEMCLRSKRWHSEHKEETRIAKNKYAKQKRKKDIKFRIGCRLRSRQCSAIKGNWKAGHSVVLLMMSVVEFKIYIEKQWLPGMTWDNWGSGPGKWQIDHIIPCSFFNMSDPVEQYMCFRYQNLQPLWWEDNITKSGKVSFAA